MMHQEESKYDTQPVHIPPCPPSYGQSVNPNQAPYQPTQPNCAPSAFVPLPTVQTIVEAGAPRTAFSGPVCVGPNSSSIVCPNCYRQVRTKIKTNSQKSAHICCLVLFFLGCFLCSCIPYCMKSFKIVHHECPNCGTFIGSYKG